MLMRTLFSAEPLRISPRTLFQWVARTGLFCLLAGPAVAQSDSMESVVSDFLGAGLVFQNHDRMPYMYLGDPSHVEAARSSSLSLDGAVGQLRLIQSRLLDLPEADDAQEEKRRSSLNGV